MRTWPELKNVSNINGQNILEILILQVRRKLHPFEAKSRSILETDCKMALGGLDHPRSNPPRHTRIHLDGSRVRQINDIIDAHRRHIHQGNLMAVLENSLAFYDTSETPPMRF